MRSSRISGESSNPKLFNICFTWLLSVIIGLVFHCSSWTKVSCPALIPCRTRQLGAKLQGSCPAHSQQLAPTLLPLYLRKRVCLSRDLKLEGQVTSQPGPSS